MEKGFFMKSRNSKTTIIWRKNTHCGVKYAVLWRRKKWKNEKSQLEVTVNQIKNKNRKKKSWHKLTRDNRFWDLRAGSSKPAKLVKIAGQRYSNRARLRWRCQKYAEHMGRPLLLFVQATLASLAITKITRQGLMTAIISTVLCSRCHGFESRLVYTVVFSSPFYSFKIQGCPNTRTSRRQSYWKVGAVGES